PPRRDVPAGPHQKHRLHLLRVIQRPAPVLPKTRRARDPLPHRVSRYLALGCPTRAIPPDRQPHGVYGPRDFAVFYRWVFLAGICVSLLPDGIYVSLGGLIIIIGVALGIRSVTKAGSKHLDDTHKVRR